MDGPKLLFIMNEFLDEDAWNAYSCIYYQVADAQMTLLTFFFINEGFSCMCGQHHVFRHLEATGVWDW